MSATALPTKDRAPRAPITPLAAARALSRPEIPELKPGPAANGADDLDDLSNAHDDARIAFEEAAAERAAIIEVEREETARAHLTQPSYEAQSSSKEKSAEPNRSGSDASRRAYRTITSITKDLPESEDLLLSEYAIPAWKVLRDDDSNLYLICRAFVRRSCGRHITDVLDSFIGPPRQHKRSDIVLLSPAELLAAPVPLDLIRDVLPAQGVAAVISQPGGGKSFLCDHIVMNLAAGRPPIPGRRFRPAAGVIVSAEGRRIARTKAFATAFELCLDNLPIRFIEQPIDLRDPTGDVEALLEQLVRVEAEIGRVGIVVVDTLARTFGAGVENSQEDMNQYVANMGRIAAQTGGLVLIAHHFGKDQSKGGRGSNSLLGALDAQIELTRTDDGLRVAKVSKLRDGHDGAEFAFRLEVVDLGPHPSPDADPDERWTSCVVMPVDAPPAPPPKARIKKLSAAATVALDAIRIAIDKHGETLPGTSALPPGVRAVTLERWQDAYVAMRPIPDGLDATEAKKERNARRMAFKRAQDELQAERKVGTGAGFWWLS